MLMVILREQNHSRRWSRSLYLVAEKEGRGELGSEITPEDSGVCLKNTHTHAHRQIEKSGICASLSLSMCIYLGHVRLFG